MKVIKLDRRYANYPKYSHAIDYGKRERWRGNEYLHVVLRTKLTEIYGPDFIWVPGSGFSKELNDAWAHSRKRQRFYFQNEAMISHIMLLLS
jgi:hypothetical protein